MSQIPVSDALCPMRVAVCDASVAPDNGGPGDCTGTLLSGDICTPVCAGGFERIGVTSCFLGRLAAAVCAPIRKSVAAILIFGGPVLTLEVVRGQFLGAHCTLQLQL